MVASKPTRYKGLNFKSRLEARWYIMLMLTAYDVTYEPITVKDPGTEWTYTPDFLIESPDRKLYYLEIKPNTATPEYIKQMGLFSKLLNKPLVVISGNFYDIPLCIEAAYSNGRSVVHTVNLIKLLGGSYGDAYEEARTHRFDLESSNESKASLHRPDRGGSKGSRYENRGTRARRRARTRHKTRKRRRGR
jgi:hypothetical protein